MHLLHSNMAVLLFFISVSVLINAGPITSQPTYIAEYCSDPSNNASAANFQSDVTSLLESLSSKAADHSFYNESTSSSSLYGLFLCRGDVSSEACENCTRTATQAIKTRCESNTSAIIWYNECMLRYSKNNFFGEAQTSPITFMWSPFIDKTSPEQSDIDARALMYPLIKEASTTDMLFKTRESFGNDKSRNRYGLAQCTRDIDGASCSSCLSQLMIEAHECCVHQGGWRILAPSCNLRYEGFLFYQRSSAGRRGKKTTIIVVSTALSVVVVAILFALVYYLRYCRKRKITAEGEGDGIRLRPLASLDSLNYQEQGISATDEDSYKVPCFSLTAINIATEHFSDENELGEGGYGPVFKGRLNDGKEVAVKRLSSRSDQGHKEFKNEVNLIAKLQHRNLVKLMGCCLGQNEKILVYEYMANGSLDAFLFDPTKRRELDWPKWKDIIIGIARGLQYLHEDSRLTMIHRDLKPSNVLLDKDMNPKISDFGTGRILDDNQTEANTDRPVGTFGYMAPEYFHCGSFFTKSDVYSFGVLMLEIVSGIESRGFSHPSGAQSLPSYAWRLWSEDRGLELVAPDLVHCCPEEAVLRRIHIGLLCVQDNPDHRPAMSSVVSMLGSNDILSPPSKPTFSVTNYPASNQSSAAGQHS